MAKIQNETDDAKVKVWTRQHKNVLKVLKEERIYKVKERYIRKKLENCADIYLDVYKWLRHESAKRMEISAEVKYPIWLSIEEELKLPAAEGMVFFELEIPRDQIMIFDMMKWDYIVNYLYLPKDRNDRKRFKEKLKKYNINVESEIYLENFYPRLKKEMTSSWKRLFDSEIELSDQKVAISWELREEWVVDYEYKDWALDTAEQKSKGASFWSAAADSKKRYIEQKYGSEAKIFLKAYDFFVKEAKKIVQKPNDAEYPFWAAADPKTALSGGGGFLIRLKVPKDKVIFFDKKKWNQILNLSYIADDQEDLKKHKKNFKKVWNYWWFRDYSFPSLSG